MYERVNEEQNASIVVAGNTRNRVVASLRLTKNHIGCFSFKFAGYRGSPDLLSHDQTATIEASMHPLRYHVIDIFEAKKA